jgi:uncharacterized membrane-anchored protein
MSEPSDQPNPKPDKTWLSSFMLVLGVLALIAAIVALFTGTVIPGLFGLAVAAVSLALGRALDYLQEIVLRLDRLESRVTARQTRP